MQASASAMQSRYAIHICGSGIPSMRETSGKLQGYAATRGPAERQVPYLNRKEKKNTPTWRRTGVMGATDVLSIGVYLINGENKWYLCVSFPSSTTDNRVQHKTPG